MAPVEYTPISRPFKARHPGGRCAKCGNMMAVDVMIRKLKRVHRWYAPDRQALDHIDARLNAKIRSSQYAHDECLTQIGL